jgi:hypothetical protein
MTEQPRRRELRLEIPANLAATYANASMVTQTHSEIIVDFLQVLPNDPRARALQRLILTPATAKLLLGALNTQIERFEEKHGEITLPPQPISLADHLFGQARPDEEKPTDG